jgi:hypothetical protein
MHLSDFLTGRRKTRKSKAYIDFYGYIMVYFPDHPRARCNGYVLLHYHLWEKYHYACLLKWCRVIHLDRDKRNNTKTNLKAMMGNNYKFRVYRIKSSIST